MQDNIFKHYRFRGTHREVGRQHGEALREQIRGHLELTCELALVGSNLTRERALSVAALYQPYILRYAPGFAEELVGLGEGAGIATNEALLLQVRQEVVNLVRHGDAGQECTSFAIMPPHSKDSVCYAGQNADLTGDFESISNVVTFAVEGKPRVMMVIPAGQLSYIGKNDRGMAVNCNFLPCSGWKKGYPRYLISRLLLEQPGFELACAALEAIGERASSRNVLISDSGGNIADYETTSTAMGRINATSDGYFVHSNHFLHPDMLQYETSLDWEMTDSVSRHDRLRLLITQNSGAIDSSLIQTFLRDHTDEYSLCMHPHDVQTSHTFCSVISNLTGGEMLVAKGNPCAAEYATYYFD